MPPGTILVIDDQKELADLVRRALEREGYDVIIATSGTSGLEIAKEQRPDLVVLDLTMPDLDGLEVCRALREDPRHGAIPILVLSARAAAADRVAGLEVGADDYLIKPFEARELVLRVGAILRRAKERPPERPIIEAGALKIDVHGHSVTYAGQTIPITANEFKILEHLARHAGRAFSRDEIVEACLGRDAAVTERTVDAHVVNIRRKLGAGGSMIETVWGVGYRLNEGSTSA
jgi:DNA-binding response OmpR family regulator